MVSCIPDVLGNIKCGGHELHLVGEIKKPPVKCITKQAILQLGTSMFAVAISKGVPLELVVGFLTDCRGRGIVLYFDGKLVQPFPFDDLGMLQTYIIGLRRLLGKAICSLDAELDDAEPRLPAPEQVALQPCIVTSSCEER